MGRSVKAGKTRHCPGDLFWFLRRFFNPKLDNPMHITTPI